MKEYLQRSMSYEQYLALVDSVIARGETTGPVQSPEKAEFTRLNRQRMKRLAKTIQPDEQAVYIARSIRRPMVWLILTEAWCGDAAQNLPVIEKFAEQNDSIETRYILRDENPDLMDEFLTDGARSIPKLIALDAVSLEVLGAWGPRPSAAREYFLQMKESGLEKSLISENLQRWYNSDKGESLLKEIAAMSASWDSPHVLANAG